MSHGWVRVLADRETIASSGRFGAANPGTLRAKARRSGYHELGVYLREAVRTVSVDWRVVNPRLSGRLLRAAQFGGFAVGVLVILLVVLVTLKSALGGGD